VVFFRGGTPVSGPLSFLAYAGLDLRATEYAAGSAADRPASEYESAEAGGGTKLRWIADPVQLKCHGRGRLLNPSTQWIPLHRGGLQGPRHQEADKGLQRQRTGSRFTLGSNLPVDPADGLGRSSR